MIICEFLLNSYSQYSRFEHRLIINQLNLNLNLYSTPCRFDIIRKLTAKGVAVIYITHKLDEVFQITDECTVFRDGQYIGHGHSADMTSQELISMMVGREVNQIFPKIDVEEFGDVVLEFFISVELFFELSNHLFTEVKDVS